MKRLVILPLIAMTLLSGCYPMPEEDDCSTVPTTNNSDVTRDSGGGMMPGIGY